MKTHIKNLFLLPALIAGPGWLLLGAIVGSLFSPVDSSYAQSTSGILLKTITNPTPAANDSFGFSAAAMGSDRVLIGMNKQTANSGAAAYLFRLNGTLITTFNNPTPASANNFGFALAALGNDRVIIGARYANSLAGAAYLFNTNGTLLTTFTNTIQVGNAGLGESVAAVGSDRVLIGAPGTGEAYLFNTNGTLLNTFTNPSTNGSEFGYSVAAMGSDRVLIGAYGESSVANYAGAAYLFSTNGTLLTTFTNPAPADSELFGFQVTAVGSDRVLISAVGDNAGDTLDTGAAYLFSTNGTLLTTFTSPNPAYYDNFGWRVAAVGIDRVLISAYGDDTGALNAGAAYLFSTNGTLLTTFSNPTLANNGFGWSVAAVGSDRVLIGAQWVDTGATDAGAAYLFAIPYPPLSIARNAATVSLKWVTPETGLALQQASVLNTSTVWSNTSDSVSISGLTNVVQQTMATTNRFFRLYRP